jgi:hypothetical protein
MATDKKAIKKALPLNEIKEGLKGCTKNPTEKKKPYSMSYLFDGE